MPEKIRLLVIAGPTGVGKSETAVKVAQRVSGEIVSADSIQVFRYFDIGSGKLPAEVRKRARHHLVDFLNPDEHFSLWDFKEAARNAIADISSRGKVPVLVGGTGLYIRAVLENLEGGVSSEPELRASLMENIKSEGSDTLYEWLIRLNPAKAARIHPNDTYRVIRGIENSLIEQKTSDKKEAPLYETSFFVFGGPRGVLYERINRRVIRMFERGWIKETENILAKGYSEECKPFHSVGYRQIMHYLKEKTTMDELIAEVQKQTRHYAKRQITWFNSAKEAVWINSVSVNGGTDAVADYIDKFFSGRLQKCDGLLSLS